MTRNGAADLDVRLIRDEGGQRLLLGVESRQVKLAVIAPDDVSRKTLETTAADCVRELAAHLEDAGEQPAVDREQSVSGCERTERRRRDRDD